MWATLLANAADSARSDDVLPAFVSILRELSPVEAVILETLYRQEGEHSTRIKYTFDTPTARFNPASIRINTAKGTAPANEDFITLELPFRNFRVIADNLMRLGLIEQYFSSGSAFGEEVGHRVYSELTLTPLGHHLVQNCVSPPGVT